MEATTLSVRPAASVKDPLRFSTFVPALDDGCTLTGATP